MKNIKFVELVLLMVFALLSSFICKAETKVSCLVFSGKAGTEYSVDIATFNRVIFGDNSMIITSSKENSNESVELLYTLYNHLEIGDAIPVDTGAAINVVNSDSNSRLYVDAIAKLLLLECMPDSNFSVGIFNVNGNLLLSSELCNADAVTLKDLTPGVYIAVATDGNIKLNLKFILN